MQVSSLSQNNINYRGFKADYKALQRQYYKTKFFHSNNQNSINHGLMIEAQNAFEKFCRSNPLRSALMKFPENFKFNFKSFNKKYILKNQELRRLEVELINERQKMTIDVDGEKLSLFDFSAKCEKETSPLQKEKMQDALIKSEESLKPKFSKLILKRNEFAQKRGYKNYYEFMLKNFYDMDSKEVDELIDEYTSREDVNNALKKRLELLAQFNNTRVEELKPEHYKPLVDYYNVNDYIKSPEQIFDLVKNVYQNMGFDVKKMEEQGRIFYDLYPHEGKPFGSFCQYIPEIKSVGICSSIKQNINSLGTLLHEFGHAFNILGTSNILSTRNKITKNTYAETYAMMFENIIGTENLLKDLVPEDVFENIRELHKIDAIARNIRILSEVQFEKEIYENPYADYNKLKANLNEKYYLNKAATSWYHDHFVKYPIRRPVYLKAFILAEKMYNKASKALGGNLLDNPETASFLTKKFFRYGRFMNDRMFNKTLNNLA